MTLTHVLLAWTALGMLVVGRLQPRLTKMALLVLVAAVAWPISLAGHLLRARRQRAVVPDRDA